MGDDAGSRATAVLDWLIEDANGTAIYVALQVAADLVVGVAQSFGLAGRGAIEQQPRRLDRAGTEHNLRRPHLSPPDRASFVGGQRHACHPATSVGEQPFGLGVGEHIAAAAGDCARDHGVMRPVLELAGAGEADAGPAGEARTPAAARLGVDQQGGMAGRQPERRGSPQERRTRGGGVAGDRWHWVGARADAGGAVSQGVARHADLPFGAAVVRLKVRVGDRPVGQRAARGDAVGARHAEILRAEPQGHRPVHPRATTEGHGVVVPAGIGWGHHDLAGSCGEDPRVTRDGRPGGRLVAEHQPLVAQVIGAEGARGQPVSALHEQHPMAGLGEDAGRDAAARPGTDHHNLV